MVRSGKSISKSPRKLSSADAPSGGTVILISQPIEHLYGVAGDSLAGGPPRVGAQTANTRATEGIHCFMRGLPRGIDRANDRSARDTRDGGASQVVAVTVGARP